MCAQAVGPVAAAGLAGHPHMHAACGGQPCTGSQPEACDSSPTTTFPRCTHTLTHMHACRVGHLEQEPKLDAGATVAENIAPAVQPIKDKLAEFEAVSVAMSEPGADLDALTGKMARLQVCGTPTR